MTATEESSSDNKMPPNEADTANATAAEIEPEAVPLTSDVDGVATNAPKAKFTSNADGKGDMIKVDIETPGQEPAALKKADLMKYATDPFWVRLRWALFIIFWIGWLAMLVSAIVIIILAPKCPAPAPKQWWQKGPIYEVYVKSFKDSDGDGVGDIKGVISKLDYIRDLGVGAVWLSPVYQSPMKDNGYDISDYRAIDPTFGTMDDFKELVSEMHNRGLKLIMDFVPNHSSDKHEWFEKSVKKEEPFTDYYVWAKGKGGQPPNNWISVFGGGSAWEFNAKRGEYYLHQFYKEQPDLNLRNEKVVNELIDVMTYWLDTGVDGFRVDSVAHFFEDEQLRDEPRSDTGESGYRSLDHKYTYDAEEVIGLLKRFRATLDAKTEDDPYSPRIMMTEAYLPASKMARYYGNVTDQIGSISQMPLNGALMSKFRIESDFSAEKLNDSINDYLEDLPDEAWSNFGLGNHDHSRPASRFGKKRLPGVTMVTMMLQGTPITYYGDEIGMVDGPAGLGKGERDLYRTPMQWSAENPSAGFTDAATPFFEVNSDYAEVNVDALDNDPASLINVYRRLAELRLSKTVLYGSSQTYVNGSLFALARIKKGNPGYLVVANFDGDATVKMDLTSFLNQLPERGILSLVGRPQRQPADNADQEGLAIGSTMSLKTLTVPGYVSYLITFVPNTG